MIYSIPDYAFGKNNLDEFDFRGGSMKKLMVLMWLIAVSLSIPIYVYAATPAWINGISAQYPAKDYLIGVGVGDTLDNARSSARAEIAKVFKAKIVQSAQETKNEQTTQAGSSAKFSSRQDTALSTSVSTDELLQGVEIAETWQDRKKKNYYALAILNKRKSSQALMQQITDQEEIISAKRARAASAASTIEKLQALNGALEALQKKDELAARKQVLDPVAVSDIGAGSVRADIENQKAALISKIHFIVQTDDTPHLAASVSEKISSVGFATFPAPAEGKATGITEIMVYAKTAIELVERNNPQWIFYGWHATVSLTEGAMGGRVIATVVKDGQSSQMTANAAKTKAVADATRAAALVAEQEINTYIFGK